ncbi:hypothetical protein E2C01_008344 [Portunus trituberculatus]|uniref:Uncharacterized protein n=1 Tax=Portunus trituberculatus TaxID=210409 RepID=A0A5B7D241_PORTR|nr:hypothetical protein [Portunus trituberculatus]
MTDPSSRSLQNSNKEHVKETLPTILGVHLQTSNHSSLLQSSWVQEVTQPFTPQLLATTLGSFKSDKLLGLSIILYEFLTHIPSPLEDILLQLCTTFWSCGNFLVCWKFSTSSLSLSPARSPHPLPPTGPSLGCGVVDKVVSVGLGRHP